MKQQIWLGCPDTFTMLRREFKTKDLNSVLPEVAEWLGCDVDFIASSFAENRPNDGSTKKRVFERHHQRHAVIVLEVQ